MIQSHHLLRIEQIGKLCIGQLCLHLGNLSDSFAGLRGFLGDGGGSFVADQGGEGGGEHEAGFDEGGAALGGFDAVYALRCEVGAGVGE